MKEIVPSYYGKFRCIADKCRHTCCKGWEIDIDEESLDRYLSVQGNFGQRLRDGIDDEKGCFILKEDEACPFLNKNGLCDMIIELGEDSLCGICSDHPRFRNFYSDRIEIGLGLCCEEAARVILTDNEPFSLNGDDVCISQDDSEFAFFNARQALFEIASDRNISIVKRLDMALMKVGVYVPGPDAESAYSILSSLEILDGEWLKVISKLKNYTGTHNKAFENIYERLLIYFIYRHTADSLYDGMFSARVGFCVMSVRIIMMLTANSKSEDEVIEICRMFSSEIEYSQENTYFLIEKCIG